MKKRVHKIKNKNIFFSFLPANALGGKKHLFLVQVQEGRKRGRRPERAGQRVHFLNIIFGRSRSWPLELPNPMKAWATAGSAGSARDARPPGCLPSGPPPPPPPGKAGPAPQPASRGARDGRTHLGDSAVPFGLHTQRQRRPRDVQPARQARAGAPEVQPSAQAPPTLTHGDGDVSTPCGLASPRRRRRGVCGPRARVAARVPLRSVGQRAASEAAPCPAAGAPASNREVWTPLTFPSRLISNILPWGT